MTVEFRILGPVEVLDGAVRVELRAAKVNALLAALVIQPNQVISADQLVEALWGEEPPPTAANALQGYVAKLRKILGPEVLSTRSPGYVLTVKPEASDAGRFEALVTRGQTARREGRADEAAELLGEALALWRGPALADFAGHPFARAEAARLEECRLVATEELIEAELVRGRHTEIVGKLRTLVDAHPLRERLWGQLMVALYRSGRGAEALHAYSAVCSRLGEELGIEPGPALRRLQEDMLLQRPDLDWRPPTPPAKDDVPTNLHTARSSFVGRHEELVELEKLLAVPGLVTVVGPGGVGKTRLALEAARGLFARYPDGVWLVELAPLVDPGLVPEAVAAGLGVRAQPGRPLTATLASHLAHRRSLVVLDNCEHLIEAAAALADALLGAAAHLGLLATSREPLAVEGETLWRARPMAVAEDDDLVPEALLGYDGVRLFCERAQSAEPSFALDAGNAPAVARLCRRLDGIPLALELAAARSRALSPAQIADRLDDRFRLLTTGARTAQARQQTLQAAIDWSHDLLGAPARVLFRRLSVFRGFTLDSAEAVCAGKDLDAREVAGLLGDLVDRSLVVAQPVGDTTRYGLLETLRDYAAERLAETGEEAAFKDGHLDWCLSLTDGAHGQLFGAGEAQALKELDGESANLRLGLRRAVDSGVGDVALRLAIGLARLWKLRGHSAEAVGWLEAALAASPAAPAALRARALAAAAVLCLNEGSFPTASAHAEHAVNLARDQGDDLTAAEALGCLHDVARATGDFERAESLLDECLAAWRASGAVSGFVSSFAGALASRGERASAAGRLREASAYYEEALAVATELAIDRARAGCLFGLGVVAQAEGRLADARRFLDQAAPISERLRDARTLEYQSFWRSLIAFDEGDIDEAVAGFRRIMTGAAERGDRTLLIRAFEGIGRVVAEHGDLVRAATLFGAAASRREAAPWPVPPVDRHWYDAVVARLRDSLGDSQFETAWNRGATMSTEDLVRFAGADRPARLRARRPHHATVGRE